MFYAGNVYAYESVYELNLKRNHLKVCIFSFSLLFSTFYDYPPRVMVVVFVQIRVGPAGGNNDANNDG